LKKGRTHNLSKKNLIKNFSTAKIGKVAELSTSESYSTSKTNHHKNHHKKRKKLTKLSLKDKDMSKQES